MRRLTYWKSLPLDPPLGSIHALIPTQTVDEQHVRSAGEFEMIIRAVKELGCMYEVVKLREPVLLEADTLRGRFPNRQ